MKLYNSSEAESRFAELIDMAEKGEDIVIARYGRPVVRLVPVHPVSVDRSALLGALKTNGWVSDDFDEPLPHEVWSGSGASMP